jgi:anti-sigma B factor antagonist
MRELSMEAVHDGGGIRLTVRGELDLASADRFADEVRRLSVNQASLRLDLSGVQFMDSRGVQALVNVVAHVRETGCRIDVEPRLAPQVERIVEITGVERLLCAPRPAGESAPTLWQAPEGTPPPSGEADGPDGPGPSAPSFSDAGQDPISGQRLVPASGGSESG